MEKSKLDHVLEIAIAIMLGITAVITAFASWQASLYGGSQATNYTEGTAKVAEGNSMYNDSAARMNRDMQTFLTYNDLQIDLLYAQYMEDENEEARVQWKIDELSQSITDQAFVDAINWAYETSGNDPDEIFYTPFDNEEYYNSYFSDAIAKIAEGNAMIEQGKKDNASGDILNLSTVIYALVLFLLGIVNTFQSNKIKIVILSVSIAAMAFAVYTMCQVPFILQLASIA